MQHFAFGLHLPIDGLRALVVSGAAHPLPEWSEECGRQFRLARISAAQTARLYADAGFGVVIDDIIGAEEVETWLEPLIGRTLHKVLLLPRSSVARGRNAHRSNKTFDTSVLDGPIQTIHGWMTAQTLKTDWLVLDNSDISLEQTVGHIHGWVQK